MTTEAPDAPSNGPLQQVRCPSCGDHCPVDVNAAVTLIKHLEDDHRWGPQEVMRVMLKVLANNREQGR